MRVAVIFDNFGPYHIARLTASSSLMTVLGVEVAGSSQDYAWVRPAGDRPFEQVTLFPDGRSAQATPFDLARKIAAALDAFQPDIVAIPGWHDRAALAALHWVDGKQDTVRIIVMSESNRDDGQRSFHKEFVKRHIVGLCSAGLVGGTRAARYLEGLGMAPDQIALGYDVVDNGYFAAHAAAARSNAAAIRSRLNLPDDYFLSSCRFIPKKNLPFLIDAYAAFRASRQGDVWPLVLMGDGEMRPALEAQVTALGLGDMVRFPGFVQYESLPAYYGLARAFVLASTVEQWGLVVNEAMASGLPVLVSNHCGCAADLVVDGQNGFTFDPNDQAGLVRGFGAVADHAAALGAASAALIAPWSPDRFAHSLAALAQVALAAPPPRASAIARLTLRWLAR